MNSDKNKILVVGIPRSGTTILTNFINSFDNCFCFIEPHWEYRMYKNTRFFKDEKLKGLFFLKYEKNEKMPLDNAINKILKKFDVAGFKETFRSAVYEQYDLKVVNDDLLKSYQHSGYKLIPIVRNPLSIWNSFQRNNPPSDSWAADLGLFIENYCNFFDFIKPMNCIIYEKFIHYPQREFQKMGIRTGKFTGVIKTRKSRMGDKMANLSSKITTINKPRFYTEEEKKILEKSRAMELCVKMNNDD